MLIEVHTIDEFCKENGETPENPRLAMVERLSHGEHREIINSEGHPIFILPSGATVDPTMAERYGVGKFPAPVEWRPKLRAEIEYLETACFRLNQFYRQWWKKIDSDLRMGILPTEETKAQVELISRKYREARQLIAEKKALLEPPPPPPQPIDLEKEQAIMSAREWLRSTLNGAPSEAPEKKMLRIPKEDFAMVANAVNQKVLSPKVASALMTEAYSDTSESESESEPQPTKEDSNEKDSKESIRGERRSRGNRS